MANLRDRVKTILPWDNAELEELLSELIAHGTEAAKVDFKLEVEASTPEQKTDLLTDISAIANTYDETYEDHGFLLYGIKGKVIVGTTKTETDVDKLQNHIEQLLKTYISPMPQIYVAGFVTPTGERWGAIVVPPRNAKPYMFFKEFQCANPKHTRRKGDWFVRRGATTDHGLPEDLALITQKQTEQLLEPLRESVRSLQLRLSKTEDQYNSALFKKISDLPIAPVSNQEERGGLEAYTPVDFSIDLSTRLRHRLRTPTDAIAQDLVTEARRIRAFLDGATTGLPWAPQLNDPAGNKAIVEDLEERTRELQLAVATILLNDHEGTFTDALIRTLKMLAKATEVPTGVQYNRIGAALRYYPLGLILYTVFVCGVAANRGDLLKKVLAVPLRHRERNMVAPITEIFFFWYEARALFSDAFGQQWCEPLAQRIRQVVGDHIGEMLEEYSEAESFFRGEFVLALTNIDLGMTEGKSAEKLMPLPGLYLYSREVCDPIAGFLLEYPEWLDELYGHPVGEILDAFDRNAIKIAVPNCLPLGLIGLKTSAIYQESLQKRR